MTSKAHARGGHHHAISHQARPAVPDGAVYIGLLMIGAFGIYVWQTFFGATEDAWKQALVGYAVAMAALVNFAVLRVYLGSALPPWMQSLARLPLRFLGYGTRGGRPFEAAHGDKRVGGMLAFTLIASAAVVAGLAWALLVK